jgi:type VI secretion system protein ImpF
MAKSAAEKGVTPSMLDRLIDPDSGGTQTRRGYGIEQMVSVVGRDLEELLNTRLGVIHLPEEYPALQQSPLAFGLPDFGSVKTASAQSRQAIGRSIEEIVERFEPRLVDVRVHLVSDPRAKDSLAVRFQIEAKMRVAPFPDVSFETVLELTTGSASVKETKG